MIEHGKFGETKLRRCIALFCLLLVVVLTSTEAVHIHPDSAISRDGARCLLCLSLHANAPVVTAQPLPVQFAVAMMAVTYEVRAQGIASRLELFTRPPPA